MIDREVMQQALEQQAEPISTNAAMRDARLNAGWGSEQQAKPVAWWCCVPGQDAILLFDEPSDGRYPPGYKEPLYATPPQRPWVGLTGKDIIEMWPQTSTVGWDDIRLIEAKLKQKNGYNEEKNT